MSIDGSRKEYLYLVYLKLYPQELERITSSQLIDIALERKYGKRKVDISTYVSDGRTCMIEVQLSPSNDNHFRQVQELICRSDEVNTLIVWVATKFRERDLIETKHSITYSGKNIEFIALAIDEEVVNKLEVINSLDSYKQVDALKNLRTIQQHLTLVEGIRSYNGRPVIYTKAEHMNNSYTYKQEFLLDILKELRKDCKFFANIYQYKSVDNNYFTLGSGYEDINFRIIYNRKKMVGVELIFSHSKSREVFFHLLNKKNEIEDELDYLVTLWDSSYHKIATYINPNSYRDRESATKLIARITKKYIYVFDKHIKEAIEDRKNNI
ncbi:DUF4268 domain-containing protein [Clostridium sp.]|uniref:DUF4268 domain-containing protein n=1 Tax=Clostridium sp. TaxID=1506 RepID=UPI002FCBFF04